MTAIDTADYARDGFVSGIPALDRRAVFARKAYDPSVLCAGEVRGLPPVAAAP